MLLYMLCYVMLCYAICHMLLYVMLHYVTYVIYYVKLLHYDMLRYLVCYATLCYVKEYSCIYCIHHYCKLGFKFLSSSPIIPLCRAIASARNHTGNLQNDFSFSEYIIWGFTKLTSSLFSPELFLVAVC